MRFARLKPPRPFFPKNSPYGLRYRMKTIAIDLPEAALEASYPNRYTAIPVNGEVCAVTGLKHAKLYTLLSRGGAAFGKVRVANLRESGTKRGKTLFHVGDMLRYLDAKATENMMQEAA